MFGNEAAVHPVVQQAVALALGVVDTLTQLTDLVRHFAQALRAVAGNQLLRQLQEQFHPAGRVDVGRIHVAES